MPSPYFSFLFFGTRLVRGRADVPKAASDYNSLRLMRNRPFYHRIEDHIRCYIGNT